MPKKINETKLEYFVLHLPSTSYIYIYVCVFVGKNNKNTNIAVKSIICGVTATNRGISDTIELHC